MYKSYTPKDLYRDSLKIIDIFYHVHCTSQHQQAKEKAELAFKVLINLFPHEPQNYLNSVKEEYKLKEKSSKPKNLEATETKHTQKK